MVVVSQQPDMHKIQKEMAESLGLTLDGESLYNRANKLRTRLMGSKRILVIFDDVWERLKMEDLGVPYGFERCKILVTSRGKDVLRGMQAKKVILMDVLSEEEAWTLFKEKAGEVVEVSTIHSLAKDVAAECKGLPIAIVTVGLALAENESIHLWKSALEQLRQSNPIDFPQVLKDVYKPIKFSYDYLENERAKSLFLLCCMFPEDYNISIELLTFFTMGLHMFEGIKNVEAARYTTYALVEMLKSRFLLIDGEYDDCVEMHDVVRDVAIFIGSKEPRLLKSLDMAIMDLPRENSTCNNTWMSVNVLKEDIKHIGGLHFPNLSFLMIIKSTRHEFVLVDNFFEGMTKLRVLSFSKSRFEALPRTLRLLQDLRTLCFHRSSVQNISIIGELKNLETLSCVHCYSIMELPVEIGKLTRLKNLELYKCSSLDRIAPGVISSLVLLEELIMRESFSKWEADEEQEKTNASLTELNSLTKLTRLEIEIDDESLAAEEILLSQNLVKYQVKFQEFMSESIVNHEKLFAVELPEYITLRTWICVLARNTEFLQLTGDGSNNLNLAESKNLKVFIFDDCSTMKILVNAADFKSGVFPLLERLELFYLYNLEEICKGAISKGSDSFKNLKKLKVQYLHQLTHLWKSPNQNVSLCNLSSIKIEQRSNLRYLFSVSTAMSLLQLEKLVIDSCAMIETVFEDDSCSVVYEIEEPAKRHIIFPKLKDLKLVNLHRLTSFCKGIESIKFPELTNLTLEEVPELKEFAPNEICLNSELHDNDTFHFVCNQKVEFRALKVLRVKECSNLRYLFSVSTAMSLLQLEILVIKSCKMIETVFEDDSSRVLYEIEEQGKRHLIFPKLKELKFKNLPCLTSFCKGIESIKFPELTKLPLEGVPKLNEFASNEVCLNSEPHGKVAFLFLCNQNVELAALKYLHQSKMMDNMSIRWCVQISISSFRNIEVLDMENIQGVSHFMPSSIAINLVNLELLRISNCPDLVQVIADEEEELSATSMFPNLEALYITDLFSLRNFCQWKHDFELPSLKTVSISDCPIMETFSLGSLRTPKLTGIFFEGKKVHTENLNGAIHHRFESQSFSLEKWSGKKSYMIAARDLSIAWGDDPTYWRWISHPESRFPEVAELLNVCWFDIRGKIDTKSLSPGTNYAAYLVFNVNSRIDGFAHQPIESFMGIVGNEMEERSSVCLDLYGAQSQRYPWKSSAWLYNLFARAQRDEENDVRGYPKKRSDSWMEVELGEYFVKEEEEEGEIKMGLMDVSDWIEKSGIVIEGIEIRPKYV